MGLTQSKHHLLGRFIFHRSKILEHDLTPRLNLVRRKTRSAKKIRINPQRVWEVACQRRTAKPRVSFANRLASLQTEAIQVIDELATVTWNRHLEGPSRT